MNSETAKHRHLTLPYCRGQGIDLGCGCDPVLPDAVKVDVDPGFGDPAKDARDLFFVEDESIDFVYSSHLLQYFADWDRILREWLRVIKPGGHLVLLVPDRERFRARVAAGQPDDAAHRREGRAGELTEIVQRIGGCKVLQDRFTADDDYSIFFVAQRTYDGSESPDDARKAAYCRIYDPTDKVRPEYAALLDYGLRGNGDFRDWEYPHSLLALDMRPGMKCLSIGAHWCRLSRLLSRTYPGNVLGIDISDKYWQWVQESGASGFLRMNATSLNFPDASFDRIISVSVLNTWRTMAMSAPPAKWRGF